MGSKEFPGTHSVCWWKQSLDRLKRKPSPTPQSKAITQSLYSSTALPLSPSFLCLEPLLSPHTGSGDHQPCYPRLRENPSPVIHCIWNFPPVLRSLFFFFFLFMPAPAANGSSPVPGVESELQLRPQPQSQQRWIQATSATYITACGSSGSLTH